MSAVWTAEAELVLISKLMCLLSSFLFPPPATPDIATLYNWLQSSYFVLFFR